MIAIKGMEQMPSCCLWDCPLAREDGGACQLADVRTSDKGRPKNCPLVEIVTCKDCKHCCHITDTSKVLLCEKHNCQQVSKNFYCADK